MTPRKRVAVMQPYFFPYAGYFRLFAQVDEFIIFDCVQFPRRGRVHRAQVPGAGGKVEWLTLPLAQQARAVLIRDLAFAPAASEVFAARLARLGWFVPGGIWGAHLAGLDGPVVDFLQTGLGLVCDALGLTTKMRRSSSLGLDAALRGQDRVIAAAQAVGATHYLNAPGGRDLYDDAAFTAAGLTLEFLPAYSGRFKHLLPALMAGDAALIRDDILSG